MTYCSFPKTLGGGQPLLTKAVGFLRFLSCHNRSSADGDVKSVGCLPSHMANTAKKATPRATAPWNMEHQEPARAAGKLLTPSLSAQTVAPEQYRRTSGTEMIE